MNENHLMDRLLKEVLMMELMMHTEKNDIVFHTKKTEMVILVVEIDVGGMTADVVDKVTCSSDDVKPKQVDLKCAHALTELHWHDIHVVPDRHEVNQWFNEVLSWLFVGGYRETLVVEIDVGGMTTDVVDKVTCSSDDVQPKQVDIKCTHALTEPHWHDIHVVPDRHEVDQRKWTILNRFKNHSSMLSVQHIQFHSALP
nr:hypothetical protein [Tanacetum cinerariifolium]